MPILTTRPARGPSSVTPPGPAAKSDVQQRVFLAEDFGGHDRAVIVRPTANDRIQVADDRPLRTVILVGYLRTGDLSVPFPCFHAGLNQRLEPKHTSFTIPGRVCPPLRELPHREPKEIKARCLSF